MNKRKSQTHSVYVMSVAAFTLQSQALGGVGAPNVFLDMVSRSGACVLPGILGILPFHAVL